MSNSAGANGSSLAVATTLPLQSAAARDAFRIPE
jgi:hypothetical protein